MSVNPELNATLQDLQRFMPLYKEAKRVFDQPVDAQSVTISTLIRSILSDLEPIDAVAPVDEAAERAERETKLELISLLSRLVLLKQSEYEGSEEVPELALDLLHDLAKLEKPESRIKGLTISDNKIVAKAVLGTTLRVTIRNSKGEIVPVEGAVTQKVGNSGQVEWTFPRDKRRKYKVTVDGVASNTQVVEAKVENLKPQAKKKKTETEEPIVEEEKSDISVSFDESENRVVATGPEGSVLSVSIMGADKVLAIPNEGGNRLVKDGQISWTFDRNPQISYEVTIAGSTTNGKTVFEPAKLRIPATVVV